MSKLDLSFALDQPNAKAIAYFLSKKIVAASKMKELGESAHARAYTNAGVNNLNLLQDFKDNLDKSIKNGTGFNAWRDQILDTAKAKGWLARVAGDKHNPTKMDVYDEQTGQIIPAYRLKTIYNTNMNGAFQAARYQQQMENAPYTPNWEYVAVGDERTRPSHLQLNGAIYPYDDPFWTTYYPPNGYNCRCTVVARTDHYLKTNNIKASKSNIDQDDFGDYVKPVGSHSRIRPDKGFSYNHGRHGFRPNLDAYAPHLAQQFARRDMQSPEFKAQYARLEMEYLHERKKLELGDRQKISTDVLNGMRTRRRYDLSFTAGVIPNYVLTELKERTIWLSDDTILKQLNSRLGSRIYNADIYAKLPEIIQFPNRIIETGGKYIFIKRYDDYWLRVLVKRASGQFGAQLFAESIYDINEKELNKLLKKSGK